MNIYFVYILASKTGVLYVGMTNNLERRVYEHKLHLIPGFTSKYNIDQLVYYSDFPTALEAIESEKRIKKWSRVKKLNLIKELNPTFGDLSVNLEISRFARDDEEEVRDDVIKEGVVSV